MGLFDMFKKTEKKSTLEEADRINKEYLAENPVPHNDENALMRRASSLITAQKFQEGLELYKQLANDYPKNRGLYLSQVGVGYHFLHEFDKAIDYYVQSRDTGYEPSMNDDNIWDACELEYSLTKDKSSLQKYLGLCPDGNHAKEAQKLLAK